MITVSHMSFQFWVKLKFLQLRQPVEVIVCVYNNGENRSEGYHIMYGTWAFTTYVHFCSVAFWLLKVHIKKPQATFRSYRFSLTVDIPIVSLGTINLTYRRSMVEYFTTTHDFKYFFYLNSTCQISIFCIVQRWCFSIMPLQFFVACLLPHAPHPRIC